MGCSSGELGFPPMAADSGVKDAARLDAEDELREFRNAFVIDDPDLIYLDGNSLGRMPKRTADRIGDLLRRQWGAELVRGWKEWYDLPQRLGAKIAALVGARPHEVLVCDSTSVNLFKLTMAALHYQVGRRKMVTDDANFPSDIYVSAGVGAEVEVVAVEGALDQATARIRQALGPSTALLSLSHTLFKSGYVHEMKALTSAAHEHGALALWDLSHSVGALPVDLNGCGADLAVGCCYKYIAGGPGAPAFLYVREDLADALLSPICGWFGRRDAFDFSLEYEPAPGIGRFLAGTPPILSMAAVEPAVDLLLEAGIERLRAKSLRQTSFLIELIDERLVPLGFTLETPRQPDRRGSHVSIGHEEAWRINLALIHEMQVIPDFRAPNILRLGVTPLSTTFQELAEAVERIRTVAIDRRFAAYPVVRTRVT